MKSFNKYLVSYTINYYFIRNKDRNIFYHDEMNHYLRIFSFFFKKQKYIYSQKQSHNFVVIFIFKIYTYIYLY